MASPWGFSLPGVTVQPQGPVRVLGPGPPIGRRPRLSPRSRLAAHVGLELQKFYDEALVGHGMAEDFLVVRDRSEVAGEERSRPWVYPSVFPPPASSTSWASLSPHVNGPWREDGREGAPEQRIVSRGLHGPVTRDRALQGFTKNPHGATAASSPSGLAAAAATPPAPGLGFSSGAL